MAENQTLFMCQFCPPRVYFSSLANLAMHISADHVDKSKPSVPAVPEPALKLYVAGPMTGLPNFNYEAFNEAADLLSRAGYEVFNPADSEKENTSGQPQLWHWYMRRGITKMMLCDGIALLDGYENSRGALIEINLAYSLGMELKTVDAWLTA